MDVLTPPKSTQDLVQKLRPFSLGSKNLLTKGGSCKNNNLVIEPRHDQQMLLSSFYLQRASHPNPKEDSATSTTNNTIDSQSASIQSNEPETPTVPIDKDLYNEESCDKIDAVWSQGLNLPRRAKSEPGHLLYAVGGASHTAQEATQESFDGIVGHADNLCDRNHGCGITIRQNYARWDEYTSSEPKTVAKEKVFHCLTQACGGDDIRHLRIHTGHTEAVCRWRPGSIIRYSIDYNSFLKGGRSEDDADYALSSLQTALEVYNMVNIGVEFQFVEPNTSPVVFQLKYKDKPWGSDTRYLTLARSFFPNERLARCSPLRLHVFAAAFEPSFRPHMKRVFLHECAHILGGRHENAATTEQGDPSIQLGSPNPGSVLVNDRSPSAISLHWKDIQWFCFLMGLREGEKVDGYPVCDIAPEERPCHVRGK